MGRTCGRGRKHEGGVKRAGVSEDLMTPTDPPRVRQGGAKNLKNATLRAAGGGRLMHGLS
ncbi:hypothetical protein E2C01_096075 [Portunus trituberculatus]|uniref:Uncharacterized protein n=1 Tax=Portunus trituberculatus TaxID=210409 RepID=A0A5B7K1V0_PORTR|nr:hypothetical protein [Portunus trituberculatus]